MIFLVLGWVKNAEMAMKRQMEKDMPHSSSYNCFCFFHWNNIKLYYIAYILLLKKHLGSLPRSQGFFWRPYWLMRFLISGIKPTTSVTTEIAPKGVGAARNYTTSAIRITTLTITFHARWMVLVELAFLLKRQIYTPDVLIFTIIIKILFLISIT